MGLRRKSRMVLDERHFADIYADAFRYPMFLFFACQINFFNKMVKSPIPQSPTTTFLKFKPPHVFYHNSGTL